MSVIIKQLGERAYLTGVVFVQDYPDYYHSPPAVISPEPTDGPDVYGEFSPGGWHTVPVGSWSAIWHLEYAWPFRTWLEAQAYRRRWDIREFVEIVEVKRYIKKHAVRLLGVTK